MLFVSLYSSHKAMLFVCLYSNYRAMLFVSLYSNHKAMLFVPTDGDSPSSSSQTQELASNNKAAGGEGAVASMSSLQVSMVALIAWVVVMTLALVTLSIVMYRRWRHTPTFDNQSVSGASESPSDLSSEFETENSVTAENETGARNNHGFSSDDAAVAEPCQVHATVTQL